MKKLSLHDHLQNSEMLAAMFLRLQEEYQSKGFDKDTAILHVALTLTFPFTGKKKLTNFDMDKYSRVIIAVVDAVIHGRN